MLFQDSNLRHLTDFYLLCPSHSTIWICMSNCKIKTMWSNKIQNAIFTFPRICWSQVLTISLVSLPRFIASCSSRSICGIVKMNLYFVSPFSDLSSKNCTHLCFNIFHHNSMEEHIDFSFWFSLSLIFSHLLKIYHFWFDVMQFFQSWA